jgi:hypothetical protein
MIIRHKFGVSYQFLSFCLPTFSSEIRANASSKILDMPYSNRRSTFFPPCFLDWKMRKLRKMNVPVTPYEVGRDELLGCWLRVERVQRRTGVPYVTLYDYPNRKPIR